MNLKEFEGIWKQNEEFYKLYYGGVPSRGSFFWKTTPSGFYKHFCGGRTLPGLIFLKNDIFFKRFIETKMTRSAISSRIHRSRGRDQFSRPVSRASGIFDFWPLGAPTATTTAAAAVEEFPVLLHATSTRTGEKYPRAGEPLTPII